MRWICFVTLILSNLKLMLLFEFLCSTVLHKSTIWQHTKCLHPHRTDHWDFMFLSTASAHIAGPCPWSPILKWNNYYVNCNRHLSKSPVERSINTIGECCFLQLVLSSAGWVILGCLDITWFLVLVATIGSYCRYRSASATQYVTTLWYTGFHHVPLPINQSAGHLLLTKGEIDPNHNNS